MTQPAKSIAGQLASTPLKYDVGKYNAEASAAMRFGIFVKAATGADADRGALLLSDVSDAPIGITGHHHNYDRLTELDETTGGILKNVDVSLRMFGVVEVRVEGTIKFGDHAHVRAETGAGGTVMGVARADAVSLETIDCTNLGMFVGPNSGGFAPFFINTLSALSVPEAGSVDAETLAAEVASRVHGTPAFTIGAESTNDRPVSIQFKDVDGNAMTTPVTALVWLSDTDVLTLGTAADTIVATTGQVLKAHTAALLLECVSDASGVLALTITKSGTSNRFLNVSVGGHVHRSAVIGFTT